MRLPPADISRKPPSQVQHFNVITHDEKSRETSVPSLPYENARRSLKPVQVKPVANNDKKSREASGPTAAAAISGFQTIRPPYEDVRRSLKPVQTKTVATTGEESATSTPIAGAAAAPLITKGEGPCCSKRFLIFTGVVVGVAIVATVPLILFLFVFNKDVDSAAASSYEPQPTVSLVPTSQPSLRPSSIMTVSPDFQIRLYWEEGYLWQDSVEERFYCMKCTECEGYSTQDGRDAGCLSPGTNTSSCREGHLIWVERCRRVEGFTFEIIQHVGSGSQVRVHGTDLCFSKFDRWYLELRPCNQYDPLQLWVPFSDMSKFELMPYEQRSWDREDAMCLSQQHHPKSEELVGLHLCEEARRDETLYWAAGGEP